MPVATPAASVEQLAADTAALAEAVSLAIRIEPQLLRTMRLALFPNFDAGTEADLWFSAVVETRTSSGIVMHPSAREALRQQLGTNRTALETAWTVVESLHREISPALFAEEKLAYLTLAGKQDEARELLRSVVATLVSPRGRGLAGWAAQAVDRLPQAARPMEEAQMLTLGASLRLGDGAPRDSGISAAQAAEWAAWLSPDDLEMVPFGVALLEDAVEFGPVGRPSSHRILLPKTTPIVVELGWSDGISRRTERTALKPDGVTLVELGPAVTEVDLKTVLGDSYTLTIPAARERPSSQKKVGRIRPPRVQITYDVETGGAIERKELPFVVAVLADLSGSKPSGAIPLSDRKLIDIDHDNFNAVMTALKPRISIVVGARGGRKEFPAELEFLSMDDFEPAAVAKQIEFTRKLMEERALLANLRTLIEQDPALASELNGDLQRRGATSSSSEIDVSIAVSLSDIFMKTTLERYSLPLEQCVAYATALMEIVRDSDAHESTRSSIEAAISGSIASLDKELSHWINPILHDPAFQSVEATWRGLNYLVWQTEIGEQLKVRVWDVSKDELAHDLVQAYNSGQAVTLRKLYEEENSVFGESPISLIVGAYQFDRSPNDVDLLRGMGAVAAASHAPFVAAARPGFFDLESFEQLGDPRDLARIFDSPGAAEWKELRQSDQASYLALTLPRILLRLPYGRETRPIEEFDFEEDVYSDHSKLLWGNAAFALAARVTNAFARSAWPAGIRGVEGGGLVEGLPAYTFTTQDGDLALKCPTEISITDRREKELSDQGFIPLTHTKGTAMAAFFSVNSIQKAAMYESSDATYAARLSIRLSYRLAASRFAHYLKCMMRDKIGSFMSAEQAERFLNHWISQYVQQEPNLSATEKAKYPLQSARIEVQELTGRPGAYRAILFIRPDFLLDDPLPADMQVIVDLPAPYGSSIAL